MDHSRHAAYTTARADIVELVPSDAKFILDVGCSSGELGLSLKSQSTFRKVVGLERDTQLYKTACERLDHVIKADLDNFDWNKMNEFGLFDCVIFADVLEHTINPERHIKECLNILKNDGIVIISLPNIQHITSLYTIFLKGTFPRRERGIFDRTHLRWFTVKDGKELLRRNGLEIRKITYGIRVFDNGDAPANKIARKILDPIQENTPVKQFFAYQFCILARKIDILP